FAEHLIRQKGSPEPTFTLDPEAKRRHDWRYPPLKAPKPTYAVGPDGLPPPEPPDELPDEVPCIILGNHIASFRKPDKKPGEPVEEEYVVKPGDEVIISTMNGHWRPVMKNFAVCDFLKSEMAEYDSMYVYVPLDVLQQLRTMEGRVNTIHIKLKDYADA